MVIDRGRRKRACCSASLGLGDSELGLERRDAAQILISGGGVRGARNGGGLRQSGGAPLLRKGSASAERIRVAATLIRVMVATRMTLVALAPRVQLLSIAVRAAGHPGAGQRRLRA